jgi:hypothetical protein
VLLEIINKRRLLNRSLARQHDKVGVASGLVADAVVGNRERRAGQQMLRNKTQRRTSKEKRLLGRPAEMLLRKKT